MALPKKHVHKSFALVKTDRQTEAEKRVRQGRMLKERQARRLFERLDLDADGVITHAEFIKGLRCVCMYVCIYVCFV